MTKQARELRELTIDDLTASLAAAQKDLFQLRFRSTTEKLDSPSQIRKLRRQIARIKTVTAQKSAAVAGS